MNSRGGATVDSAESSYYRARYYDSAAGRFLNEDPMRFAAGGANFYEYAANNPLNLKDSSGLNATVSYGPGGTITVSAAITIYGPGATSALATRWQKDILDAWNNQGNNFHYGKCKVNFNVVVTPDLSAKHWFTAASNPNFPALAQNYISVPAGDDVDTGVSLAGFTGNFWSGISSTTVAHEAGHLFGLGDDYWPFSDPPLVFPGHKNHMMADNGDHTIVQ
jgi:RHS repeat-associated protein